MASVGRKASREVDLLQEKGVDGEAILIGCEGLGYIQLA
jgi:hypothetical protein